jgi:hypothetical protein
MRERLGATKRTGSYVFAGFLGVCLFPILVLNANLSSVCRTQVLPIARVSVQENLCEVLEKIGERHPLVLKFQGNWSVYTEGVVAYATKDSIIPWYMKISKAPAPEFAAVVLRRIKPAGPVRMVWTKSSGQPPPDPETQKFAHDLMRRVPHRVLKVLDEDGDRLIEFFPDKGDVWDRDHG